MIEFGKTLREAREKKGYTISQLAELTRIMPQIVEDLENEVFSKIVAGIYGRGFVKLYCEQVGLDAAPLITAFMDLYTGNRNESSLVEPVREEAPPAVVDTPPTRDYRTTASFFVDVPRRYWRFGLLAAAALAIAIGLVIGCRALYRATMTPSTSNEAPALPAANAAIATPRKPMAIPPLYID